MGSEVSCQVYEALRLSKRRGLGVTMGDPCFQLHSLRGTLAGPPFEATLENRHLSSMRCLRPSKTRCCLVLSPASSCLTHQDLAKELPTSSHPKARLRMTLYMARRTLT